MLLLKADAAWANVQREAGLPATGLAAITLSRFGPPEVQERIRREFPKVIGFIADAARNGIGTIETVPRRFAKTALRQASRRIEQETGIGAAREAFEKLKATSDDVQRQLESAARKITEAPLVGAARQFVR